jgi:FMN-dependent NADH-azoreductase
VTEEKPVTSLLHLDSSASPLDESVSRQLTRRFADTWRAQPGTGGYTYRDLAAEPVPPIGPAYASLGRRVQSHGVVPPGDVPEEHHEWTLTRPLITELLTADTVLLGVPMYNFSIPAALKTWIDRVTFPGAFVDPDTGHNLLRDKHIVVVMARGGGYGPGTPRADFDFQTPYLRAYFTNLGVENVSLVEAELTRAAAMPDLTAFIPLATASLAAAHTTLDTLATSPHPQLGNDLHYETQP